MPAGVCFIHVLPLVSVQTTGKTVKTFSLKTLGNIHTALCT